MAEVRILDNPIFSGSVGIYNGIVWHESPPLPPKMLARIRVKRLGLKPSKRLVDAVTIAIKSQAELSDEIIRGIAEQLNG